MRRLWALVCTLAFFGAPVVAQDPTAGSFEITDPRGDPDLAVHDQSIDVPTVPEQHPSASQVDIVALRLAEDDASTLRVEIELAAPPSPANAADFKEYYFRARFQVGDSPLVFELWADFLGPHLLQYGPPQPVEAYVDGLCVRTSETLSAQASCHWQTAPAAWDVVNGTVTWAVPKVALVGGSPDPERPTVPAPAGMPSALPAGTPLSGIEATAQVDEVYAVGDFVAIFTGSGAAAWIDRVPDEGPAADSYPLVAPLANHRLRFAVKGWPATDSADVVVAIEPGSRTQIDVTLINDHEGRRIVNLRSTIGPGDVLAAAKVPDAIEIPGRDSRFIRLGLDAKPDTEVRDRQTLQLVGEAAGSPGEVARLRITVVAGHAFDPARNIAHFHAYENSDTVVAVGGYHLFCDPTAETCWAREQWINPVADDPAANMDDEGYMVAYAFALGTGRVTDHLVTSATPLVRDLQFRPGAALDTTLAFTTDLAFDGELTVQFVAQPLVNCDAFSCPQRVVVAEGSWQGTFEEESVISLPLRVDDAYERVPSLGHRIGVRFAVTADVAAVAETQYWAKFRLIPAHSRVVLPLIADQEEPEAVGNITVRALGVIEDFVNPGATRGFHVAVTNQGTDEQRVRLVANVDPATWTARLEPSDAYVLPAGTSVNVTVLVSAPPDAAEGDVARIEVASESADGASRDRTRLRLVATTGVTLADDSTTYSVDPEASQRVVPKDDGGRSPGLTSAAVVAVLAAAVFARRRHTL